MKPSLTRKPPARAIALRNGTAHWCSSRTRAAAESLGLAVGTGSTVVFPALLGHHEDCERRAREALGEEEFETARQKGRSLDFDEAVAYGLGG